MNMKKYWTLIFANYRGNDDRYYFANYEVAKKSFDMLAEAHKDDEEFSVEDDWMTWFDPNYNEYSTYVDLVEEPIYINENPVDFENE
jgi:hypothetical protein